MKKYILVLSVIVFTFLSGCSTKRQYFEPTEQEIVAKTGYEGSLPDDITFVSLGGATLKNGTIIMPDGLNSIIKLEENDEFLGEFEGKFIISNKNARLRILDQSGSVILERTFPEKVVSASISGDDLALITANNVIYLIKLSSDAIMMVEKSSDAFAVDSRIADPVFIGSLIVYPVLDGKVIIVDRESHKIAREFIVSSEPFFNNITSLNLIQDRMYAATSSKIMRISPDGNKVYSAEIKNVVVHQNKIYLFLKDGVVEILDQNLNKIKEKKFVFAIFSGALVKDDSLYIIEKTGYLIKTDLNLENAQIFELDDEIADKIYLSKDTFYCGDKYLKFN